MLRPAKRVHLALPSPTIAELDRGEEQKITPSVTETADVQDKDEDNGAVSPAASKSEQDDNQSVSDDGPKIPEILPILPLKETVVYPFSVQPLAFGQDHYIHLVDDVMRNNRLVVLVAQKSPETRSGGTR